MKISLILGLAILLFDGFSGERIHAQKPESAPLLKQLLVEKSIPLTTEQPQEELTLEQALAMALQNNPQLTAFSLEIRAREAAALQAALRPNPELELETENFAGSGPLAAFKATETTVSLGQLIELGGKRQKRMQVAVLQSDLASWEYEARKLDVFTQVVTAFSKTLAAQELVRLNTEILSLAEEFQTQIERRVQAGRVSPAALSRAQVETAKARIALQRSKKTLTTARQELAATWGATHLSFKQVRGNLDQVVPLPPLERLKSFLQQNPDLARWQTVKEQRKAARTLAEAQAVPDPHIRIGWRRFNDNGDQALVAGVSIPLPLLNRNQGAVQEAAVRIRQAEWQERSARIELQTLLNRYYQTLAATQHALKALKDEIIPQAQQAFDTIDRGYREGKFGFLDVLDARRTLFSARQHYVQQLAEYQQIRAQIERLVGQSLNTIE